MKKYISVILSLVMVCGIFSSITCVSMADGNVTGIELNKYITTEFSTENSNKGNEKTTEFTLNCDGKMTIDYIRPQKTDGSYAASDIIIKDSKDRLVLMRNKSAADQNTKNCKFIVFLKAGTYKINEYVYDLYGDLKTAQSSTKFTFNKTESRKIASPLIVKTKSGKVKAGGTTKYTVTVRIDFNGDYNGLMQYVKYDDGDWKVKNSISYVQNIDNCLSQGYLEYTDTYYSGSGFRAFTKFVPFIEFNDGSVINGTESNVIKSDIGSPAKPKVKVKLSGKKNVKISWNKVKKAEGYLVYASKYKKKGFKKICSTDKRSFIYKKTKRKKTYYFKVKAFATAEDEYIPSKLSAVKKIKIK